MNTLVLRRRLLSVVWFGILVLHASAAGDFRPPAVPLVTHDPYFSIWSAADRLTDVETTHWTGKPQPLHSALWVDGIRFRLMGSQPMSVPALPQESVSVLPTRTIYRFGNAEIAVTLTFLTPALPAKLDVLSRPLTYITWEISARDGHLHDIALSFDASPLLAVNTPEEIVSGEQSTGEGWRALSTGTVAQPVLEKEGDDLRIDWGHAYVVASEPAWCLGFGTSIADLFAASARTSFAASPANVAPVLHATRRFGSVGTEPVHASLMLAYDDGVSLRYFDSVLKPYWRRHGMNAAGLFTTASADYPQLTAAAVAFDRSFMADFTNAEGEKFARIASLAYRQTLAGCKLAADANGAPLLFPKENHSNGCISTVDVIYPMLPFFYVFSPTLARAALIPVLDYAASPRWKFDFAPHDLGRYPHATGQVYGGGERSEVRQMPVEESADLILLVAGLARVDGRLDLATKYWPQLDKWAHYLEQKGFDPENQLCTDDFAGHLAHNVNLSAKTIIALGAYAQLCGKRGFATEAQRVRQEAENFARLWTAAALDKDHYRLAFDHPGTWSQKYNLIWDRVLGLGLFDAATLRREMDFYLRHALGFGLPLDSRSTYTKLDWTIWTAALTGRRADQDALIDRVYKFIEATPNRVPLTDWYYADTAKLRGFIARPVVGGVFMPICANLPLTRLWSDRAEQFTGVWAALPLGQFSALVPTGENTATLWRFTTIAPKADWVSPDFDDRAWATASGGFFHLTHSRLATRRPENLPLRTNWGQGDLWLRHGFTVHAPSPSAVRLRLTQSGPVEVYLNGVLAGRFRADLRGYEDLPVAPAAIASLHTGRNVLALHVSATAMGFSYVDAGLLAAAGN